MFAERLKQLREEKKMTQQELSNLLHVGRATIAGYETKGKEPDFDKIIWFANYFDVSLDYLLGNTDEKKIKAAENEQPLSTKQEELLIEALDLSENDLNKVLEFTQFLKQNRNQ